MAVSSKFFIFATALLLKNGVLLAAPRLNLSDMASLYERHEFASGDGFASGDESTPKLIGLKIHDELALGQIKKTRSLIETDMKSNSFPEINHWLLAKINLSQKNYREFRKHLSSAKALGLLHNTKYAKEIYDASPRSERAWLVRQISAAGYFETPAESSCPYFELTNRKSRAEFLYLLSQENAFDSAVQKKIFRELYVLLPETIDKAKLDAIKGFSAYEKSVSVSDTIKRIEQLLTFGKNIEARESYTAKMAQKKPPLSQEDLCNLEFVDAKIDRKLRKYDAARSRFKEITTKCADETVLKARYLDLMLAAQRGDEKALPDFAAFVEAYPEHSFSDDVLMAKANLLVDKDRVDESLATLDEIIARYPHGDMIDRALFLKGYRLAKLGKAEQALLSLGDLKKRSLPSSMEHAQAQYWIARLSLFPQLDRSDVPATKHLITAKKTLYELVNLSSPNVYSWLAYGLLTHMGESVVIKKSAHKLEQKTQAKVLDRRLDRIENLVMRGFRDEAVAMLDDTTVKKDVAGFGTRMATLYDALDRPAFGHQKLVRCDFVMAHTLQKEAPDIYQRIAYPRPFLREVSLVRQRVDVPEEIIFAIMRQESGFIPESLSWAGAKGLMQLMYPSALGQATTWGIKDLQESDLYKPSINVLLASSLLQSYWQQFGSIVVGLAAYNAGPSMAKQWQKKNSGGLYDSLIEEITFKETRDYVKLVLGNIYTYGVTATNKTTIDLSFKHIASIK